MRGCFCLIVSLKPCSRWSVETDPALTPGIAPLPLPPSFAASRSAATTPPWSLFVATNNVQGGVVAADRLAAKLGGKGKGAIPGVKAGSVSTDQREQGFKETIKQKHPRIESCAFQYDDDH